MRNDKVLLIVMLFTLPLSARALEVRGRVVGADGKPVVEAVVLHRPTGASAETGADGKFVIEVTDEDRIRLEIIHPDHYDMEFSLTKAEAGGTPVFTLIPLIQQREEILVTALRYPEPSVQVPAASSVVESGTLADKRDPNIAESLQSVPGVDAIGGGGFSLVPTVRGLARRRVLYLVDGARIESDRRTGPNASFISPEDIERIEVLRSPSSVFYGSDAIGGVIHLMTKSPSLRPGIHGRMTAGYGTVSQRKTGGLLLEGASGRTGALLSFQGVDAENYSSPLGEVLQSYFTQGSLMARIAHRTDQREIEIGFLAARGRDIGKPLRTSDVQPTWYPRENQNLFQFSWREIDLGKGGELLFKAFANPNFLETRKEKFESYKTSEEFARTESTEYGAQLSYGKKWGASLRFEGGVDVFGRGGAEAFNTYTSFDESGTVTEIVEEEPFTGGKRKDVGFFLSADFSGVPNLDILGGVRWDVIHQEARPSGETDISESTDCRGTGFLAASYRIADGVTAFVNVSKAYRVPSINELFYTGISGRGYIVGNPDLVPETSVNLDGGVRFLGRRHFLGLYGYSYEIRDMIERYRIDPTTRTYGNIEKGRIQGLEFEVDYFVRPGWKIFGNVATVRGRSVLSGDPLNDVPPFNVHAGTRIWLGRFSAEASGVFRSRKNTPGPDEIEIPASEIVNVRASYTWTSFEVALNFANVFNATYLARPDSDAMEEPGRNLRLTLSYTF